MCIIYIYTYTAGYERLPWSRGTNRDLYHLVNGIAIITGTLVLVKERSMPWSLRSIPVPHVHSILIGKCQLQKLASVRKTSFWAGLSANLGLEIYANIYYTLYITFKLFFSTPKIHKTQILTVGRVTCYFRPLTSSKIAVFDVANSIMLHFMAGTYHRPAGFQGFFC